MATSVANLIIPEVFDSRFLETTAEKVRLLNPMVNQDSRFDELVSQGGDTLDMPFFQDLSGDSQVLAVGTDITVNRLNDSKDVARRHGRAQAWTVNDLESELTGSDPLAQIINRVGAYWARETQRLMLLSLDGVFADNLANDSGDLINDVSINDFDTATADEQADAVMSRKVIATAKNKLGDSGDVLTMLAVHSDVYTELQVNDQIRDERDSEANLEFESFAGKRLIVDDSLPKIDASTGSQTSGTQYTSYLFGMNAIGYAEGMAEVPSELDRKAESSETRLFTRRQFIMHPRGFKWAGGADTNQFPSDAEIADADNWDRVFEKKNTRIVKIVTNLTITA